MPVTALNLKLEVAADAMYALRRSTLDLAATKTSHSTKQPEVNNMLSSTRNVNRCGIGTGLSLRPGIPRGVDEKLWLFRVCVKRMSSISIQKVDGRCCLRLDSQDRRWQLV